MKHVRLAVRVLAIAALAVPLLATVPAQAGTAHSQSSSAFRTSSGPPGGQVIVTGKVLSARGSAVPDAQVALYAWPKSWDVGRPHHPGENVPMILIGRTISGSSGRYSIGLSARSASVLARSASLHGIVNFELAVASRDGTADYSFPRRLAATTHGPRLAVLYSAPGRPQIAALRVDGATRSGRYRPDRVCVRHHRLLSNFRERWEPFGATYSTTSGVKQGFTYTDGQSTTFSVGTSATGDKGTFKLDGSFSLENSSATSVTPPSAKGPALRQYDTHVVNGKYYVYWTNADCGLPVIKTWPNNYPGGGKTFRPRSAPAVRRANCEFYGSGFLYRKTNTKAATFEKGYSIPAIGFTVSTQTGWSHTAVLWYRIGHRGRHLCGTTAKPGNNPRTVVEKR